MKLPAPVDRNWLAAQVRRRLTRAPAAADPEAPRLSVVVPFYNVENYLADCLDSILAQAFTDFEVILVDDGSPDGSRRIAEDFVERDSRVRLVTRENGGLGAARNTGVGQARGSFLTFVDSDDVIPAGAFQALVGTAEQTGSDVVVGAPERFNNSETWTSPWVVGVHADRRLKITIAEFTPLLRNLYTWGKVFRRDFWDAQGLAFREDVAYEDQPIITQLFARAGSIDVISETVYNYRDREDRSSISQQSATIRDLRDRVAAWQASREVLRTELDPETYSAWLVTLFDTHFVWYLVSPGTVDDDYWALLAGTIRDFAGEASPAVWEQTRPTHRVLSALAIADRRADAQEFVQSRGTATPRWPTRLTPHGVLLELPLHDDSRLADDLFLLRPGQMNIWHAIESIGWAPTEDGWPVLRISGRAYLDKVDLAEVSAQVSVVVEETESGRQWVFPTRATRGIDFALPQDDSWCDYLPGAFEVAVPWRDIGASASEWRILLRVEVASFAETRPMTELRRRGATVAVPAAKLPVGGTLILDWNAGQTLRFGLRPAGPAVTDLVISGRTVSGKVTADGRVVARHPGTPEVAAAADGDGSFVLDLPTPEPPANPARARWTLSVAEDDDAPVRPVECSEPEVAQAALSISGSGGTLLPQLTRVGRLVLREGAGKAIADGVQVTAAGALRIQGRVLGYDDGLMTLFTTSADGTTHSPEVDLANGRFDAVLPLTRERGRFGVWMLRPGSHDVQVRLQVSDRSDQVGRLELSSHLAGQLPTAVRTDHIEALVLRGPDGVLRIRVERPLGEFAPQERQLSLQRGPRPTQLIRGLLLRTDHGDQATDSAAAIQAELRRRGSDLPVYWAVHGHHVPVPEGSIPVIVRSPRWYELYNAATYYLDNMFQPDHHRKVDGQILVQTFHGYPFKQMGLPLWEHLDVPTPRIESYLARVKEWDYVISPATYASPLLRRAVEFEGRVLEIGYPRNDVLRSAESGAIREQVRDILKIRPDQTAVLYAPTSPVLSADYQGGDPEHEFDLAAAAERLGDDFVILVRRHGGTGRRQRVEVPRGCVDVTDYPEVSDLYLAADAAVMDYSSARFDFAITGKPMIFHMPDLQGLQQSQGWLFDYVPSAPGPIVSTTDDVVDHLMTLAEVTREYAEAYRRFESDFLDLDDGQAAKRFVDEVFVPRGDA